MRFLPHLLVPLPAKKLVRQNKHTSRSTYTTELLDEFASKVSRTTSVPFGLCSDSMGRLRHMYKSLLNNMRHQVCSVFTKRNTQHAPKPFGILLILSRSVPSASPIAAAWPTTHHLPATWAVFAAIGPFISRNVSPNSVDSYRADDKWHAVRTRCSDGSRFTRLCPAELDKYTSLAPGGAVVGGEKGTEGILNDICGKTAVFCSYLCTAWTVTYLK